MKCRIHNNPFQQQDFLHPITRDFMHELASKCGFDLEEDEFEQVCKTPQTFAHMPFLFTFLRVFSSSCVKTVLKALQNQQITKMCNKQQQNHSAGICRKHTLPTAVYQSRRLDGLLRSLGTN